MRRWWLVLAIVVAGCGADGPTASPTTTTAPPTIDIREAVARWVGHLAARDDAAAFADLAPRSQAVAGDLANYQRGSGRISPLYGRFITANLATDDVLVLDDGLAAVTLRLPGEPPTAASVPVRRVGTRWRVEPLLDVGSYSLRPDDGATVDPRPTVEVQLDDPSTRARVWFDDAEAEGASSSFRARRRLTPGWHVITVVLSRGDDVVARTLSVRVPDP